MFPGLAKAVFFFFFLLNRRHTQIYSYKFRYKCFGHLEEVVGLCIIEFETYVNSRLWEDG